MTKRAHPEQDIKDAIRLGAHSLGCVLYLNTIDHRNKRLGLGEGTSDLIGFIVPEGTFLAVEVKSARGRERPAQVLFRELVTRSGGLAIVARSVDDVADALRMWRATKR